MPALIHTDALRSTVAGLPRVEKIEDIVITDRRIEVIVIDYKTLGRLSIRQLAVSDAPALFDFFTNGLAELSRSRFYPYPLFNPQPLSADDLAGRIAEWQKEDDWLFFCLFSANKIAGVVFLKRMRSSQPTTGLAVRDEFQGKGLGYLLQTIIVGQARLLEIAKLYIKILHENTASKRIHEKCGFYQTGEVPYFCYEKGVKTEKPFLAMAIDL